MSTLKIKRENGKIFCPLADSWHIETPEEKVRQEYIKILVENYGYSLDQMAQEIKVNNSQRGQGKARADIVIWKSKQDKIESKAAFIVVECKAENVRIREEDYYQGYNYASWAGASFFVTTNEKETKYFNVDKDYLPKELVEVVAIPTAEEALNDKKVKDMRLMLINKYYWNVALLTLLLSGNETLKPFIENDLGITSISTIELKFNFKYFDDVNELLKTFINRINPDHKSKIECNLEDLRNSIFYSALTDENGNILVDENGNKLLAEIGITDTEVFQNLTQAYMPKNEKIIKDIIIQIDDDITVEQLSEGEKKLMFKALGLLDDNGQPLQRYYEFLDQTQTGRIIAIGIEEAYEDLFNLRKDAQNLTNDEVKNKLKTITQGQKSDKILGLMAMTFRAFCDLADWDSVGTEETNKIETPHVVLKSDNTEKSQTKTDPTTTDMNLHYNIQIHLPETTNMAVYDAIFQSLKKHLM